MLVIRVLVILVVVCRRNRVFVLWLLHRLLLLLLVALAMIREGNCVYYFLYLDTDRATGFDLGLPWLALPRPASVSILEVLLRPMASKVLGVPLLGFISQ